MTPPTNGEQRLRTQLTEVTAERDALLEEHRVLTDEHHELVTTHGQVVAEREKLLTRQTQLNGAIRRLQQQLQQAETKLEQSEARLQEQEQQLARQQQQQQAHTQRQRQKKEPERTASPLSHGEGGATHTHEAHELMRNMESAMTEAKARVQELEVECKELRKALATSRGAEAEHRRQCDGLRQVRTALHEPMHMCAGSAGSVRVLSPSHPCLSASDVSLLSHARVPCCCCCCLFFLVIVSFPSFLFLSFLFTCADPPPPLVPSVSMNAAPQQLHATTAAVQHIKHAAAQAVSQERTRAKARIRAACAKAREAVKVAMSAASHAETAAKAARIAGSPPVPGQASDQDPSPRGARRVGHAASHTTTTRRRRREQWEEHGEFEEAKGSSRWMVGGGGGGGGGSMGAGAGAGVGAHDVSQFDNGRGPAASADRGSPSAVHKSARGVPTPQSRGTTLPPPLPFPSTSLTATAAVTTSPHNTHSHPPTTTTHTPTRRASRPPTQRHVCRTPKEHIAEDEARVRSTPRTPPVTSLSDLHDGSGTAAVGVARRVVQREGSGARSPSGVAAAAAGAGDEEDPTLNGLPCLADLGVDVAAVLHREKATLWVRGVRCACGCACDVRHTH